MKKLILLLMCLVGAVISALSQGLENVIVETYYVSDAADATDTDGGSLVEGSVTYRIFIDMAPGYELQAVYGNSNHELRIETSTYFFNNLDRGEMTGNLIPHNRIDENTVALDSWVTMNGATTLRVGVQKPNDPDGSLVGGANSDGGSEGVVGGILINNDPLAGIPLTSADGLMIGTIPMVTVIGMDLSMLDNVNDGPSLVSTGGAWSVLEGVQGPDATNTVLIAQITTDGELSFKLNIQLGTPEGDTEQYVSSTPVGNEQFFASLCYPEPVNTTGCTNPAACNYDALATEDDGSCIIPVPECLECNNTNDGLDVVDSDGDGVCNAEEVLGCTNPGACNFNMNATEEDGSCIEPVPNCYACNETNDGLEIIDSDGDGTCDAQEAPGCTSATACNYDPSATGDDGSCIEPIENCAACNESNDGLVIVDSDNDGFCDAEEIPGCTNDLACNYNPAATEDDLSCIIPEFECAECNETNDGLQIVDTDGDGVCNAEEISGCTSSTACNFNPLATDSDASCIEPIENCQACNENNDGLVIIDSDGDGICDTLENVGCTSETACNFDPLATTDDGSCLEPIEDCQACNENNDGLLIIDADNDGICDADEIFGCTNPDASNYNPNATEDDGSCEFITTGCDDAIGLEDVIVEVYYISDEFDSGDTDGGSELAMSSVTYRVYVDLAEGYELQAVFGNSEHELRLETSTYFYNNTDRGEETGDIIDQGRLDENTVALDSWVTIGAASDTDFGVLKSEDSDGSIVGGINNDGGSEGIAGGLLVNENTYAGIPLTEADGLMEGTVPEVTVVGLDLLMFGNLNSGPVFSSFGGAWSVLEGAQGPLNNNRILIAQITTDGEFCFDLNIQLGDPDGGTEQYVASNAQGDQIFCDLLSWCSSEIGLVQGCTITTACNFNANATIDDGSCIVPVEDCWECNENNTELIFIDTDGDGVCNGEEIFGCTDPEATNYNPEATEDDGSCIVGVEELMSNQLNVSIYPNPVENQLTAVVDHLVEQHVCIELFDMTGRKVMEKNLVASGGKLFTTIEVNHLESGMYNFRLTSGNSEVNIPIVRN